MKVTVCIRGSKLAIPYSEKDKVGDVLSLAIGRYAKLSQKDPYTVGGLHHLRTTEGAILDNDDFLCDVIDNNDFIKVVSGSTTESEAETVEFPEPPERHNRPSLKSIHFSSSPSSLPFQPKFSTTPRQKHINKTPDGLKTHNEIVSAFSRSGARKSLGNTLTHDPWFEAKYKLQEKQELEAVEDVNNNGNSCSNTISCSQDSLRCSNWNEESNHQCARRVQSDSTCSSPPHSNVSNISHLLLPVPKTISSAISPMSPSLPPKSPSSSLPHSSLTSRPRSAVIGYMTSFRGSKVITRELEDLDLNSNVEIVSPHRSEETKRSDDGEIVDREGSGDAADDVVRTTSPVNTPPPSMSSSASSSLRKQKQSPPTSFLAPSNTRVIGKVLPIALLKGPRGLGFTITSRDNMADMNSPIYVKNILPGGAAQLDGQLKLMDRLLVVNGVDVASAKQSEVTQLLRQIPTGEKAELVISRQINETVEDGGDNDDAPVYIEGNASSDVLIGRSITEEVKEADPGNDFQNRVQTATNERLHHHFHGDAEARSENVIDQGNDFESKKQYSMTKEMEQFLSSSISPSYTPLNEAVETVLLSELLQSIHMDIEKVTSNKKFAGIWLQTSQSSEKFQLLEVDGQPLTSDKSMSIIKAAINKEVSRPGSVVAKVARPIGMFQPVGEKRSEDKKHGQHNLSRAEQVKVRPSSFYGRPPSISAPATPLANKSSQSRILMENYENDEEEREDDDDDSSKKNDDEVQASIAFNRKGFGRQSMSEKRKGHGDPRSLEFYKQATHQKMMRGEQKLLGSDTSLTYATWDPRKAARMKKVAERPDVGKDSETFQTSSNEMKHCKSLENLSGSQKAEIYNEEYDVCDVEPSSASKFVEKEKSKICSSSSSGDNDSKKTILDNETSRQSREKKAKNFESKDHKNLISYMRKTVENLRRDGSKDKGLATVPNTPASVRKAGDFCTYTNARIKKEAAALDTTTTTTATTTTTSSSPENRHSRLFDSRSDFRSLPKRLASKQFWLSPHSSKPNSSVTSKSIGYSESNYEPPRGVTSDSRLQPEGEEGTKVDNQQSALKYQESAGAVGSETPPPPYESLANIPVLRFEEASNIYQEAAQNQHHLHQQVSQHFSAIQHHFPSSNERQHLQQQSMQQLYNELEQYDHPSYPHSPQFRKVKLRSHRHVHQLDDHLRPDGYKFTDASHQNLDKSHQLIQDYGYTTISHKPQRSLDSTTWITSPKVSSSTFMLVATGSNNKDSASSSGDSPGFSRSGNYVLRAYTPETQHHRTYKSPSNEPRYVTTLKVNCEDESETTPQLLADSNYNANKQAQGSFRTTGKFDGFNFHAVPSNQQRGNFRHDTSWTRSAHV